MMFWIGLITGAVLTYLVSWIIKKGLTIKWYDWVIGGVGVLSLFAMAQHYFGSLRENEATSAWAGALGFGLLGIILLAVSWRLVVSRDKA